MASGSLSLPRPLSLWFACADEASCLVVNYLMERPWGEKWRVATGHQPASC